jgi:MoaA/NifB/PqqE/SkfB family radical SAM enzyme/glycosyltransferase involved in cell wall biosynthesis
VLIITGWGEPLSYKYIKDVLKFINANNTNDCIRITTNGSLLTEEIAELLSKNLDSLLISLNAATKSTYERDMGNGRWDKVITNIKNAGKYIPRHKKTLTIVGHRDNIDEFPDFVKLAAELEFSTVLLYHLQVTLPENIDKSLWFLKERTNELIDRAVELGIKNNVAVVAKKFSDPQPEQGVTACEFPFDTSIIEVNGDVLPCCFAEGHRMGNIHMFDEFENLWNNKKYNHLRKERYFEACQNCQFVSDYNKLQNHAPGYLFPEILKRLPKISIVIPCNGTSKWLPEAIKKLLDQTYPVWEAIIVSGNSSEKEIKEIINCKDERIKIIEKTSKGFYSDLNEGIRHANGKYFCYMTSNSMFKLDKLEKQFKEMEKLDHHYAVIYFSNVKENVDANSLKSEAVDIDSALFQMEAINGLEGFNVLSSNPPEDLLIRLKSKGYLSKSINSEWNLNLARKFIDLGENYLLEGNEVQKAILAFKMAIEEDAYSAEAYNNLGVIYAYHRKYDEALKYLNKVLEIDPAHRKAIISVGEINRVLGKLDTTQYLYSKYLEQNSDDCEIKELLECLS